MGRVDIARTFSTIALTHQSSSDKGEITALDTLHRMAREKVERVLVVEDGRLLGIVTRGDLIGTIRTNQELGL